MSLQRPQAREGICDDPHPEVPLAVAGACMSGMQMAVVDHLDLFSVQAFVEGPAYELCACNRLRAGHSAHGEFSVELSSPDIFEDSHRNWIAKNTMTRPSTPNTLNFTQKSVLKVRIT
jgi:hypothetical protein